MCPCRCWRSWPRKTGPASAEAAQPPPYGWRSGGERHQPESGPERRRVMSAQTSYLQVDATGVFPSVILLFVLILAMLGVVAHAAFI